MGLFGFRGEIRQVDRSLTAAELGTGSILLVEGCAGAGKSTVLMNAAVRAEARGFAAASSQDRPTLRFLDRAVAELPDTLRVLPALGDRDGLPALCSWLAVQQHAWQRGVGVPLLVTVDDVAELPSASVRVLAALPTRYAHIPVVWLFSRRAGTGGPDVRRLFSLDGPEVTRMGLDPLDGEQTRTLVDEVVDPQATPELLELAGQAGGNRLLVVELVAGLVEEHGNAVLRDRVGLSALPLPRRLRAAVGRLLCSLSAGCQRLLQVVALAEDRLSIPDLATLLGESFGVVVSLIAEVVDAGVLADDGNDLVFAQELTRRVLADSVPAVAARELARELSDAQRFTRPRGEELPEAPALTGDGQVVPLHRAVSPELPRRIRAPRGPARLAELTENQHAVATLVGAGLTNQQIADRLYLSPHTVNYHLRNIFRQLAIHSRVELATLIGDDSDR
jgi:DNA-binding CsgD family transcriptional regulator